MARTRVRGWIVLSAAAALTLMVPLPASVVERAYARLFYPVVQSILTPITNLMVVAWLDVLIAAAVLLTLWRVIRLVGVARRDSVLAALWQGVRRALRATAVVGLAFFWCWGLNYRREPLESVIADASVAAPDAETVAVAFGESADLAARLRTEAHAEAAGGEPELRALLPAPMNAALRQLGRAPLARPGRPKHSLILQPFFTRAGVDGMINPIGLESIVGANLLPIEQPFVLAHEWAHLAGQADEAEASAVGWLACLHGGPWLAYSGSLYLVRETFAALPADRRHDASGRLDEGVRTDLAAIAERLTARHPAVERAAFRVYDEYLKANRVEDGTASYGRALTLILLPELQATLRDYRGSS